MSEHPKLTPLLATSEANSNIAAAPAAASSAKTDDEVYTFSDKEPEFDAIWHRAGIFNLRLPALEGVAAATVLGQVVQSQPLLMPETMLFSSYFYDRIAYLGFFLLLSLGPSWLVKWSTLEGGRMEVLLPDGAPQQKRAGVRSTDLRV
ncbi:uncharacterized protein ARMOST_07584 [Armillaria ostoyae]|uniref:Uncharacterized protein n=1 Tax=Armillaria ostoyae TaxID=47428 RepID=A0A284R682_ARMOS|nr:uncharacterized protein ARMOST_07584 [Armillaria ostoyae]